MKKTTSSHYGQGIVVTDYQAMKNPDGDVPSVAPGKDLQVVLWQEDRAVSAAGLDREIRVLDADACQHEAMPFVMSANAYAYESLERFRPAPSRKRVTVTVADVASFIGYIQEQKTPNTRIFASVNEPPYLFQAAIDYHGQKANETSWITHACILKLHETEEWKDWQRVDRANIDQSEMAHFLEDHQPEIVKPTGAEILEIATSLHVHSDIQLNQAIRLDNGATKFVYDEDVKASAGVGRELDIPDSMRLYIEPFRGSGPEYIDARFRYRRTSAGIKLRYEMVRADKLIASVIDTMSAQITAETGATVWKGGYKSE